MPDATTGVAGLVLAAGAGTRMGGPKLLLELDGEPLVRRVARAGMGAGLAPLVVVLGHDAERVEAALAGLPCTMVRNPDPSLGMASSLAAGLAALPGSVPAVVVLLGDMPFVTAAAIRQVVEAHARGGSPIVTARHGSVTAPPTLYARPVFPLLSSASGDQGGRGILRAHPELVAHVDLPADALDDVDTPDDYRRAAGRTPGGGRA